MIHMNLFRKQTHKLKKQSHGYQGGGGCRREMEWEVGVSRCKLLYMERINNKVLPYSTGNYIQYPMINHSEKEYKKECIYIYV